jgi:hypothetical protein
MFGKKETTLRQLEKRLDTLAAEAATVQWWKLAVNVALFVPTLGGVIFEKMTDDRAVAKTPVADAWLGDAAKLATLSEGGMEFLSDILAREEPVTIAEARRFVEIEKRAVEAAEERRRVDAEVSKAGLAALKSRLEQAR